MNCSFARPGHNDARIGRLPGLFVWRLLSLAAFAVAPALAQGDNPATPAASPAAPAVAEEENAATPAVPAAKEDDIVRLPKVSVSATLRDEPLLSVPIPVAVLSGAQMLQSNLRGLSDITSQMPSLTFRAGASNKDTSLLIRGVGTITTSPGVEPGVSTVVDGVVLARPGQSTMDLMDIDHVEVLRGPQGTLFGKNSSVGAVNIVSTDPSPNTHSFLNVGYFGADTEESVRAGVSGTIVPNKLLASVAFMYDHFDGNVDNVFLHEKVNGFRNWGMRAKLVYAPSTNFKATFILHYIDSYSTQPNEGPFVRAYNTNFPALVTTPTSAATLAAISPVVPTENNLQINSGLLGRIQDFNDGVAANLEWSVGGYKVTSITAYQNWYNNQHEDTGVVASPTVGYTVSWDNGHLWFDQYSEELRLTSPTGKFFNFVTGLYWQKAIDTETYRRDITQEPTAGTLVPNTGEAHYGTDSSNYSAYGEGTWNISKTFRVITGLRLTRDDLHFYHSRISTSAVAVPGIQPTLAPQDGTTSSNGVSGRAGVQYDLNKETMLFATYSKGYKGPAYNVFFNQTALQVLPLDPETSDDYELGIKALTWHGRLQFTATLFSTTYQNYQANEPTTVLGTPVTNLINAGQVSSKGIEADLRVRLTSQLTLSVTASRIDAVIDNFNKIVSTINYNGQPLPFAPKFKEDTLLEFRTPITNKLDLTVTTDYAYQTKQQYQITQTPDTIQDAYGLWNASVAFARPSDGWRVAFIGKNLTNTHYATLLTEAGGMVWRTVPRDNSTYFGVTVRKDF